MQLDAGFCEFLVYRLATDRAVLLSHIFVCHNGHGSSAAFLAIGSARVTNDDTSQEPD